MYGLNLRSMVDIHLGLLAFTYVNVVTIYIECHLQFTYGCVLRKARLFPANSNFNTKHDASRLLEGISRYNNAFRKTSTIWLVLYTKVASLYIIIAWWYPMLTHHTFIIPHIFYVCMCVYINIYIYISQHVPNISQSTHMEVSQKNRVLPNHPKILIEFSMKLLDRP